MESAYPPLSEYGLVGDCRTAALISLEGSVDWLCVPSFDAPSLFNRLLDRWAGGYLAVTPLGARSIRRRYVPGTAVLETEIVCDGGRARAFDFMPALREQDKRGWLLPFWSLLRVVEGLEGEAVFDVTFRPRPRDCRSQARVRARGERAAAVEAHGGLVRLDCACALGVEERQAAGRLSVRAGRRAAVWLSYTPGPAIMPALGQAGLLLDRTVEYWRVWSGKSRYDGPEPERVRRSALTLKLLSFAPSGAIVAAPTMSLPERLGGPRNWDYRYCWLRDAAYTAGTFYRLGYRAEADSFVQWLMYTTTRTHPRLNVFYDLYGHMRIGERQLKLDGYRGCAPVREGNGASTQRQLDVYGEVMEALTQYRDAGGRIDRSMLDFIKGTAGYVCKTWDKPDNGIWEMRLPPRHYVHSKIMCWYALHQAARIGEGAGLASEARRWRACAEAIKKVILTAGWSPRKRSLRQRFDVDGLDGALLLAVGTGLLPADDPRMTGTIDAVARDLGCGDGLLRRYLVDDGLPAGEGAFLTCSFWHVEALAACGRREEAWRLFERLQPRGGPLGLFSEEIDPATGLALGNYPQALCHLSHIDAGWTLGRR